MYSALGLNPICYFYNILYKVNIAILVFKKTYYLSTHKLFIASTQKSRF